MVKKLDKTDKKILGAIFLTLIIVFGICAGFFYNSESKVARNYGCYIYHVQECLDCHNKNLTYSLCSGFCFEPREMDLDNTSLSQVCIIHPKENCWNLPKMCND